MIPEPRPACDCATNPSVNAEIPAAGLTRRTVVRAGAAATALACVQVLNPANVRYAFAEPFGRGTVGGATAKAQARQVLVVLSLRGGFDGLNAIVPAADPHYASLRPNVRIPMSRLIPLDATFGLHPALTPLHPWWKAGTFGVVHAVGQVNPTRSHFSAMAEMERAAPGTSTRTGWLDRLLGGIAQTSAFRATQLGGGSLLGSLVGPQQELIMQGIDDFRLNAAWDAGERSRWVTALNAMHTGQPTVVAQPATTATGALATTARLGSYTPGNGAVYPKGELGDSLRDVARLIKAGLGLRVAAVDYGDWDLHANIGTVDTGLYASKLQELARAMAAFATDLGTTKMRDVTVVTLSEFGRRTAENGSGGTDHGLGNAVLLLGGGVVGGKVHGRWPGLAPTALVDGDLAGTTDYRLLLSEIATKRLGARSTSGIFPGLSGAPLGVVRLPS